MSLVHVTCFVKFIIPVLIMIYCYGCGQNQGAVLKACETEQVLLRHELQRDYHF